MKTKRRKAVEFYRDKLRKNPTFAERAFMDLLDKERIGYCFQKMFLPNGRKKNRNMIVDFYIRRSRLIIEIDGGYHKFRKIEDWSRDSKLRYMGNKVLRFTNGQVLHEPNSVLEKVKAML